VLKSAFAGPELLRRFARESEALGRLQHPGIARIYEAGKADTGVGPQPYFAMEFVRGPSLLDYAKERQLGIRERLELMLKIWDDPREAGERGLPSPKVRQAAYGAGERDFSGVSGAGGGSFCEHGPGDSGQSRARPRDPGNKTRR
jgi:hypothetical protein